MRREGEERQKGGEGKAEGDSDSCVSGKGVK